MSQVIVTVLGYRNLNMSLEKLAVTCYSHYEGAISDMSRLDNFTSLLSLTESFKYARLFANIDFLSRNPASASDKL
jgi:hypothetical protein